VRDAARGADERVVETRAGLRAALGQALEA
jgi:hypothetical protein